MVNRIRTSDAAPSPRTWMPLDMLDARRAFERQHFPGGPRFSDEPRVPLLWRDGPFPAHCVGIPTEQLMARYGIQAHLEEIFQHSMRLVRSAADLPAKSMRYVVVAMQFAITGHEPSAPVFSMRLSMYLHEAAVVVRLPEARRPPEFLTYQESVVAAGYCCLRGGEVLIDGKSVDLRSDKHSVVAKNKNFRTFQHCGLMPAKSIIERIAQCPVRIVEEV